MTILLQGRSNSALRYKQPNFDIQELLISADSPWTDGPGLNLQKGDATEMGSRDWAVNKLECGIKDDDSIRDDDSLRDNFYCQRYLPDMRREVPEFDMHRSPFDSDSDGSEMATSNSSELDMHYQFSLPRAIPSNGRSSKLKKPTSKISMSPETR